VLRYLVEDARRIDRNVLFVFKEEPIESNPYYCFTEEEVAALLERARSKPSLAWMYAPLVTLAYTGLRRGELAALDWEDIDLDAGLLRVRHDPAGSPAAARKTTKGKRTREVGLHEDVAAVLDALPGPRTGPVFLSPRGKRLDPDRFLAAFKRDLRNPLAARFPTGADGASFRDGVLHSFRHFAADRARRQGMPEEIRLQMFGHRDRETHKVYQHITSKETADAARRLPSLVVTPDPDGSGPLPESDAGTSPVLNRQPARGQESESR
jgi:integrase